MPPQAREQTPQDDAGTGYYIGQRRVSEADYRRFLHTAGFDSAFR
jgi:hypothetical protein